MKILALACALAALSVGPVSSALAQEGGVRLSSREQARAVERQLPDGRVVYLPENGGLPFLFGFGEVSGKASSVPVVNGSTPSVLASTPSGGLVPGQNPE